MLRQAMSSRFSVRLFYLLYGVCLAITQIPATVINRNRSMTDSAKRTVRTKVSSFRGQHTAFSRSTVDTQCNHERHSAQSGQRKRFTVQSARSTLLLTNLLYSGTQQNSCEAPPGCLGCV
jgi:hypothetical protein